MTPSFQLSNVGSQNVKSHAKGEKHKWNMNNSDLTRSSLKMYFKPKTTEKSKINNSLSPTNTLLDDVC